MAKNALPLLFIAALISTTACSRSNNLLLGRVEAKLGSHAVVVTDCYRTSVPPPTVYEFKPCRDADVQIRAEELTVNGVAYGRLNPGDTVTVDHGVVLVNGQPPRELARK